ncbi:MAG: 1-acyl-sn-glycerol-3-phosphate acyltransferase [Bacteroidales bacterium]|nr:1-acyl-sn-glycerol-3-phosphate acyltransferase [Bacteroidales bacterium]
MMHRKIWEHYSGYNLLRRYSILTVRSCLTSLKIEGRENIPTDGALLVAPNHCATMMDPMMVLAGFRSAVGFGARSDVFANKKTAGILYWLKILPIARERNGLQEVAKNFEVFDEIVDCLRHGLPFCLYPEGMHRAERGMLPVKKGIFRIAKQAVDQLDMPVRVLPMGLDYEYFFRGQGRAAIRFGEPIDVGEFFASHADMPEAEIYRELCTELRERDLALIGRIPERRHGRIVLRILASVLMIPWFLVCAVGSILIWLPQAVIVSKLKDKAWTHTIRFFMHFLLPVFVPFHIFFERILRYWAELFEDLKK